MSTWTNHGKTPKPALSFAPQSNQCVYARRRCVAYADAETSSVYLLS